MNRHDIINNGFSPLVRTPGLYFCIVIDRGTPPGFNVHMRHGSPAGQFWRNGGAIRRCASLLEARELIDQLAGLVDAHKTFSDVFYS